MYGSSAGRSLLRVCAVALVLSSSGCAALPETVSEDTAPALNRAVESRTGLNGSLIQVPELNRVMTYDADIETSAVVVGDSQTGKGTWVDRGLTELGYRTVLRGAGGTGYTKASRKVGRYHDALTQHQWLLPWGNPKLVVLQGGGNDVGNATDEELTRAAEQMIAEMRRTYPQSRLVMVGVISSGAGTAAAERRAAADNLLAGVAARQGVEFLKAGDWWKRFNLEQFLQSDRRHFTPEGHRAAGQIFARELGSLLAGGSGS